MIAQLRELVGDLQARLRRHEEAASRSRKQSRSGTGDPGRGAAGAHGESYKKLRADYQRLLTTRVDVRDNRISLAKRIPWMSGFPGWLLVQGQSTKHGLTAKTSWADSF
jgi:hypothetical protein